MLHWLNRKTMRGAAHRAWAMRRRAVILKVRKRNIAYGCRNRNNQIGFFFCEIFPEFSIPRAWPAADHCRHAASSAQPKNHLNSSRIMS
jgi:hypothetical protein